MRETIDTTYADLRPSDLVIDKSGKAWPIAEYDNKPDSGDQVMFWLCDRVSGIKLHLIVDMGTRAVKVSRLPTQADEAAKLEAAFKLQDEYEPDRMAQVMGKPYEEDLSIEDAVAAVEEIGGTVEAEVTAAEVDAAAAATDDAPVSLPPFADMTPLEQRSHLYLLHGLYGSDVTGKAELIAIHEQAHTQHDAGTLNSRHVPHTHEVA